MAATLKDPAERARRIEQIGEFFKQTGLPTRQIADYFTKNYFQISNKTVHQYIEKYMELYPEESEELADKINNNTEKTIEDKEVKVRVFRAAKLSLEGHTIQEIADLLDTTPKTIERDLFRRLKLLAEQDENINKIYELVLNGTNQHKIDALNENRNCNRI